MSVEVYLLSYKQQVYQYIILYTVYIYIEEINIQKKV